jgi:hypothetical protein
VFIVIKMSGAAGLSAAKRRRGGSGGPAQPTQRPQQRPPRGAQPPQPQHVQVSPMQILEKHEMRLNNLDQHIQDIVESFGVQAQAHEQQTSGVSDESLVLFRDKTTQLENKIKELEGLLQKVQTFAMETNTMVLKTNNVIDDDDVSEYVGSVEDVDNDDVDNDDVGETPVDEPIELEITG